MTQMLQVEQQDSAVLMLKSSKSFLQMHEMENIASKHEIEDQTSRNIGQYVYCNCLLTRP